MTRSMLALALLAASSSAMAAPTHYLFDSVSSFVVGRQEHYLTGILQGEATPTSLEWTDGSNETLNRCIPVFLTMMEKPGRYHLSMTLEPLASDMQTINCGLVLRN